MIERFANHRVAPNLAMIMMIMAGIWAVREIPTSLDPSVARQDVSIWISWQGSSAEDVEQLITVPIEQAIRTLLNVREIDSRSTNGGASIWASFEPGTDMAWALDQVKQRVANVRNLPADIEPPSIARYIDRDPIASILVSSEGPLEELIPLLRSFERDLRQRGIEEIDFDGFPEEELAIQIGSRRLHELGMTLDQAAEQIGRQSQNVPAGSVGRGQGSRQLRSLDQRRDTAGYEGLFLTVGEQMIRLGSVADIQLRARDDQITVTRGGKPTIEMTLMRSSATDAIGAADIMQQWVAETRPTLPEGVTLAVYQEVWQFLGDQLSRIFTSGTFGLSLVILALVLFLNLRVGWWVMVGIPVSFLLGLALFHAVWGGSINIISLIAFIMAIGIVVDDAIVVGEDAVAHFEQGYGPAAAAVAGAQRMWLPVATSSMTTLAAFIPLLIVGGVMGEMILTLPIVLLCVIAASLIECFLVLPGHLRGTLSKVQPPAAHSWRARFNAGFVRFRKQRFQPLLKRCLDYPGATVAAAFASVLITIALVESGRVSLNFVTNLDLEEIEASVEFSGTATDAEKGAFMLHLEQTLEATDARLGPGNIVEYITKRNRARFENERARGIQYAMIDAEYALSKDRHVDPQSFVNDWRQRIVRPPFVEQLNVGVEGGGSGSEPAIVLILRGRDADALKAGAEELVAALAGFSGVANVADNLPYGREQLIFSLTPTGRGLGLTAATLGAQLRAAYSGRRVQIFNRDESELEVRVLLPDDERDSLLALKQFPIMTDSGEMVPLTAVATLTNRRGIDVIRHHNGEQSVAVFADVDSAQGNTFKVMAAIQEGVLPDILDRYDLSYGLGGKSRQDQVILDTMKLGSLLTLALIYLILAWSFASYIWPLAIMTAIPFGLTGAVVGHWIMGMDVGAFSLLAFFSLTGIVVNDSIVLISFFKKEIEAGTPARQAIEDAALQRFRAVVLTSVTTVAGLLPLMFEQSTLAIFIAPIAVTVCFGLSFATLLVLLVVPALLLLIERGRERFGTPLHEKMTHSMPIAPSPDGSRP